MDEFEMFRLLRPEGSTLSPAQQAEIRSELFGSPVALRVPAVVGREAGGHAGSWLTVVPTRRQRRSRSPWTIAAAMALLIAGSAGVWVAATSETPTEDASATAGTRRALPAYAAIDAPEFAPQAVYEDLGGVRIPTLLPAIDVWEGGGATLVVRTWPSTTPAADPFAAPASPSMASTASTASTVVELAPTATPDFIANSIWGDGRSVQPITIRGLAGGIEELADDQFEFWIPSSTSDAYAVVATRGLDRTAAVAEIERLGVVDSVLRPMGGFSLAQQVGTPSSTAAMGHEAQVVYGLDGGPWLSTWLTPAGVTSVEETIRWPGGRRTTVDGHDSIVWTGLGRANVQWLDPSGVVVQLSIEGSESDALALVSEVEMIDQGAFMDLGAEASRWVESDLPVIASADLGDVQVERRGSNDRVALCVRTAGAAACAAKRDVNGGAVDLTAIVEGRWYVISFRPSALDSTASLDALSFTVEGDVVSSVGTQSDADGTWFVADLGEARTATTNHGWNAGEAWRDIARPTIASTFV
jgi:hypothetical protein